MSIESGRRSLKELEGEVTKVGHDINPVSDNSPFFYKFDSGIPKPVSRALVFSITATFLVIILPLVVLKKQPHMQKSRSSKKRKPGGNPIPFAVIFLMLGMGFMMVEISLIQRFVLFLGRPVLSLAVLLFSLLGGAGMGSILSGNVTPSRIAKGGSATGLITAIMLLIYAFALPVIFHQFLGLRIAHRVLIAILLLMPLGGVMGFPFPLALRSLKERGIDHYIPWMWGINGISSVLGSTATVVIAIYFGFTQVLVIGVGCYVTVSLIFTFTLNQPQRHEVTKKG
jgi:hypothetical protein